MQYIQYTLTWNAYPANENILWKLAVGILDLNIGELNAAIVEVLNHISQITLCPDTSAF